MQQFYKLIIKDKKYDGNKKIASFFFLINAITFIFLAFGSVSVSNKLILFTSSFILIAYSGYNWAYKKKKELPYIVVYLLMIAIWVGETPHWYFSILLLLLLVFQFRMESGFTISLYPENIFIDGFTKKKYGWSDFNNIVLKDGLLTLDFITNRVLQVEPDWNMSVTTTGIQSGETVEGYHKTEKEFNDFCKQQLNK